MSCYRFGPCGVMLLHAYILRNGYPVILAIQKWYVLENITLTQKICLLSEIMLDNQRHNKFKICNFENLNNKIQNFENLDFLINNFPILNIFDSKVIFSETKYYFLIARMAGWSLRSIKHELTSQRKVQTNDNSKKFIFHKKVQFFTHLGIWWYMAGFKQWSTNQIS